MTDRNIVVEHLRKNYTYDAATGAVVNRRGRVVKGFQDRRGYLTLDVRLEGLRNEVGMHHVVWALNYGRWPKQIDHINGNPKDNRIANLREVSQSENNMNRLLAWKPNAKTGLPGVCKSNDRFVIKVQGKELYFRDKYEAFHMLTMLGRMFRPE